MDSRRLVDSAMVDDNIACSRVSTGTPCALVTDVIAAAEAGAGVDVDAGTLAGAVVVVAADLPCFSFLMFGICKAVVFPVL